ncbi:MAG: Fe-S cluster assembly ATPase SufC [Anaerolineae bacterium]|nr:Fe-S cluster assembly ATPase SufC [Anaerolineae bacterium]
MVAALEIRNLHASVEGTPILKGVNLTIKQGETHALMGPNGSGKSTLANVLMGNPAYTVDSGQVIFDGVDLLELEPDARSRLGLFMAFQYPVAIPGVTLANFLRSAINARRRDVDPTDKGISIPEFRRLLMDKMNYLEISPDFASRYLNDGFSGGEKKRAEILQMAVLQPKIAILDETDSGLDIDALRIVAGGVNRLIGPDLGVLVITHYKRILDYIRPQHIHIMMDGRIVESGGPELVDVLEATGYKPLFEKYGIVPTEE